MSFACDHTPGRIVLDKTYSANLQEGTLDVSTLPGYIAGMTDVNIIVAAGVYLWSNNTANPAFTVSGGAPGDRVRLINSGFIMGKGGKGGCAFGSAGGVPSYTAPTAGGPALRLVGVNAEIDCTAGYIGGGGGGGGAASASPNTVTQSQAAFVGGGGGAGGGAGGDASGGDSTGTQSVTGGAGGAIGSSGSVGAVSSRRITTSGAGGGRVMPGSATNGTVATGTVSDAPPPGGATGGPGGSGTGANFSASNTFWVTAGGGGGGWGAAGGTGRYTSAGNTDINVLTAQAPVGGTGSASANTGGDGAIPSGSQPVLNFQAGAAGGKAIELQSGASRTIVAGADRIFGATS